ncbi:MAG: plasmid recombination protein [Parvibaculum sp.]|jgi:hypothetical protein|nr:plasmid recombination protein [Parvibaculum sp.]
MAFQFLHVDIVSRAVPKKSLAKRWALRDVLAEAGREAGSCPHVENPRPPARLFGLNLPDVERATLRQAEEARDAKGRRLRKDSPVMLAGVLSYPVAVAELNERTQADYAAWEGRSLKWLARRYGDTLASVVRHEDEAYPHLHFFVVPHITSDKRIDLEAIHPGIAARETAKRDGKSTKEANRMYCAAMRAFQDDFHTNVGVFHGHLREGPRRRRLSRGAYMAERRDAERRADMMTRIEVDLAELEELRLAKVGVDDLRNRTSLLETDNAHLRKKNAVLETSLASTSRALEAEQKLKKKWLLTARHSGEVVMGLICFLVSGKKRFRDLLLASDMPLGVLPETWNQMRRFLSGAGDAPGAFERESRQTRRRDGDSR